MSKSRLSPRKPKTSSVSGVRLRPSLNSFKNRPQNTSALNRRVRSFHTAKSEVSGANSSATCAVKSPGLRRSTVTRHWPVCAVFSAPRDVSHVPPFLTPTVGAPPRRRVSSSGSRSSPKKRRLAAVLWSAPMPVSMPAAAAVFHPFVPLWPFVAGPRSGPAVSDHCGR